LGLGCVRSRRALRPARARCAALARAAARACVVVVVVRGQDVRQRHAGALHRAHDSERIRWVDHSGAARRLINQ
jgi:hypothetical protein